MLGRSGLFPSGKGWGTAHPRTIFNGGSPGGLAERIRWTGSGRATARGQGVIAAYKPRGGYYATRVPTSSRPRAWGAFAAGFYSDEGLPSVLWRCTRNTAVVTFSRS